MELRWIKREIWQLEDGRYLDEPRIEKVLQYRDMYGWHDVPLEDE
jgi:hypothetical protein